VILVSGEEIKIKKIVAQLNGSAVCTKFARTKNKNALAHAEGVHIDRARCNLELTLKWWKGKDSKCRRNEMFMCKPCLIAVGLPWATVQRDPCTCINPHWSKDTVQSDDGGSNWKHWQVIRKGLHRLVM
jgi:hypothetical protein